MGWDGYGDDSRQAAAGLLARAQAGDQAAAAQLQQATQTWAPNHRNAAIDAWNQLDPNTADDLGHIKNPHKGILGGIGSFLKIAAPIAGALIPGVGMLGAGLIGAGGSAAGGLLHGDKFNLGKTLLAGGGAAAGNKLLGNGLGGGSSNWGFGSSQPGGIPTGAPGGNTAGSGGQGTSGIPEGSPGGGGGFLDRFGGIGGILQKYGPLALGAAGALSHASDANKASGLRDQGVRMATDDWNSRAPLRQQAIQLATAAPAAPKHIQFSDPTDPYHRSAA